jgi:hypothetical protein
MEKYRRKKFVFHMIKREKIVHCIPNYPYKKGIDPQEAMRILKENGLEVSPQEAALLLDFLYLFAVFSIEKKLKENESS